MAFLRGSYELLILFAVSWYIPTHCLLLRHCTFISVGIYFQSCWRKLFSHSWHLQELTPHVMCIRSFCRIVFINHESPNEITDMLCLASTLHRTFVIGEVIGINNRIDIDIDVSYMAAFGPLPICFIRFLNESQSWGNYFNLWFYPLRGCRERQRCNLFP